MNYRSIITPALGALALASTAAMAADGPSFAIVSPADGATINTPFQIEIETENAPIGRPLAGKDHLHVSVDGGREVPIYDNRDITANLPPGKHTIEVELAGPTHRALLPPKHVTVTVE